MWLSAGIFICAIVVFHTVVTCLTLIQKALCALRRQNPRYALNASISLVLSYAVTVNHLILGFHILPKII